MNAKDVKLCHYSVTVQVAADYHIFAEAVKSMALRNDQIVAKSGQLQDEFWFLKAIVKGKEKIIVKTSTQEFADNDPQFVELLPEPDSHVKRGNKNNRGWSSKGKGFFNS